MVHIINLPVLQLYPVILSDSHSIGCILYHVFVNISMFELLGALFFPLDQTPGFVFSQWTPASGPLHIDTS